MNPTPDLQFWSLPLPPFLKLEQIDKVVRDACPVSKIKLAVASLCIEEFFLPLAGEACLIFLPLWEAWNVSFPVFTNVHQKECCKNASFIGARHVSFWCSYWIFDDLSVRFMQNRCVLAPFPLSAFAPDFRYGSGITEPFFFTQNHTNLTTTRGRRYPSACVCQGDLAIVRPPPGETLTAVKRLGSM